MTQPGIGAPIVVERELPAPPEEVFAAWGDAESLAAWMYPDALRGATAEVDFRVGGRFRLVMHGEEQDYVHSGEYLELDPPKRLVMSWISEWIAGPAGRTRVSVTLEPAGDGATRLRLVHDALPDDDTYQGHVQGWTSIVEKLAARLG